MGKQFGKLTILKYLANRKVLCKCECGDPNCLGTKEIALYSVTSGKTKTCGAGTTGFKDLTGQQFGQWEVLKYSGQHKKWVCRCTCGIIQEVNLINLKTASGKCRHNRLKEDLTGKRFGYLTVLGYNKQSARWICKCDCGNILEILGCNLTRDERGTRSCGCKRDELRINTMINKYGDISASRKNGPRPDWQIELSKDKEGIQKAINELKNKYNRKPTLIELNQYLGTDATRLAERLNKFELRDSIDNSKLSVEELKLYEHIKGICSKYGYKCIHDDRKAIGNGQEIDIFIPDIQLGIEYNGSFWHQDLMVGKEYHYKKSEDCAKQGIRLIHIFDYELWDENNRKKIYKYIEEVISNNKNIVYAKNCDISIINSTTAKKFIDKYHLQKFTGAEIYIGAYYNDELLGVMTFGKPRFNSDFEYELIRLVWKYNISVVGGTERLFSYFVNHFKPKSIISYCDLSKFVGNTYKKLGFKLDGRTDLNYKWVNTQRKQVLTRQQCMKHKLIEQGLGSINETENEIMRELKYYKVYDCGNLRFVWNKE